MRMSSLLGASALTILLSSGAFAQQASLDLVEPIADYKIYVTEKVEKLAADTRRLHRRRQGWRGRQGQGAVRADAPLLRGHRADR